MINAKYYGPQALNEIFDTAIRPTSELAINPERIHCEIIGPPGCGKTTIAGTAPGPTLFLDVNYGTVSIAGFKDTYFIRIYPQGIQDANGNWLFHQDEDWETTPIHKRQEKVGTKLLNDILIKAISSKSFKTIVLDDETGLYRLIQNCIPIPCSYKYNKYVENTQGWFGDILKYRNRILTQLDQFHGHAIWLCHSKPVYDEKGQEIGHQAAVTGQGSTLTAASMDEVWFMERKAAEVTIYTDGEICEGLKSRHHLPPTIKNASFPLIRQLIETNAKKGNTPPSSQPPTQGENNVTPAMPDFLKMFNK